MLDRCKITHCLLCACLLTISSGYTWEYEQPVVIEGVLKQAERKHITRHSDGKENTKIETSVVLVTDKPLTLSHSITIGTEQIATSETSLSHVKVCLAEEFLPLIGNRVQCHGHFKKSLDLLADEIVLDVDTALDCEQLTHPLRAVFYEPEEVKLVGMLSTAIYPGPPEYMSVEMGDCPEKAAILRLKSPIDVAVTKDDKLNEPEKGVRELQVIFDTDAPGEHQTKEELSLRGTLYHAHTAHHRRRVLMAVKDWKVIPKKASH